KTGNLAEADASEKDKIKAVSIQSGHEYNAMKKKPLGPPPPSSAGIPRTFMVEVEDPNMKGAMLTNTGKYAIPSINAAAYAVGKKERQPFLPANPSSSSEEEDPVPDKFLCLICKEIMTGAVVIPCCGNNYCDECKCERLITQTEYPLYETTLKPQTISAQT
uniref:Uncharacterized protein n=1 Tax=Leptobrachium leishanense TaxID=445787 RepID=A0A8C5MZZ3_9ANUR